MGITHIETSAPSDDREVCTRKTEEAAPTMWLALAISLLFFAEAAWRFALEGTSAPDRATAIFNGVNFVLFGLLGLGCLFWPTISSWFRPKEENDDVSVVVDSGAPAAATPAPAASPKQEKSLKSLDVESGNVVAPAPPAAPKRKVTYLTNVKTFLTFIVVTFHTVCIFAISAADGIQTNLIDPKAFNDDGGISSFLTGGIWFINANEGYFMAAFYLISAYFCPKSLDRKGFRSYCIDKLVRLGGPYILYSTLLGPMMYLWCQAYAGEPLEYNFTWGPPWFILWLLNFSIIYAVGAQFLPKVQFNMPHPLLLTVGVGPVLCGIYYGMEVATDSMYPVNGPYDFIGGMVQWQYGLGLYVPFFLAGIAGGRNDWLKNIEEMKTWVVWTLRVIVVGFWVTQFLSIAQYTIPIPGIQNFDSLLFGSLFPPFYAIPMTLALLHFFYQYFNGTPQSWLMRNAGIAAYAVYVIHVSIYSVFTIAFVQILKTAGVPIVFEGIVFLTVGPDGQPTPLPDGYIWGGWVFVLVLTQCVVWPLAHFMRKLPILNKMF